MDRMPSVPTLMQHFYGVGGGTLPRKERGSPSPTRTHLSLVQRLGFSLALQGNVLIVGTDLSNDAVKVQIPVVVHGQDDRGVTGVSLELSNLLGWG